MSTESERRHEEYMYYKSRGLCPICRKAYAAAGHVSCPECIEKATLRAMKRDKAAVTAKQKQRYQRRKAEGMCVQCGGRPAIEGKVLCEKCLLKRKIYNASHYIRVIRPDGACLKCNEPAVHGKKYCARHQAEMEARAAHMRSCKKTINRAFNAWTNAPRV